MTDARLVARIGKAHGLRGEVTVQAHTDDPAGRFVPGVAFRTEAAPGTGVPKVLTLDTIRNHNGTWLLAFAEIPDRTGAESLRGTRLLLTDDVAEELDDDDDGYYEEELVGLTALDRSGAIIGRVSGLEVGAAQDLLVVTLSHGRKVRVPFVEALVPTVDLEGGRVVIDAPPGLFDLEF